MFDTLPFFSHPPPSLPIIANFLNISPPQAHVCHVFELEVHDVAHPGGSVSVAPFGPKHAAMKNSPCRLLAHVPLRSHVLVAEKGPPVLETDGADEPVAVDGVADLLPEYLQEARAVSVQRSLQICDSGNGGTRGRVISRETQRVLC